MRVSCNVLNLFVVEVVSLFYSEHRCRFYQLPACASSSQFHNSRTGTSSSTTLSQASYRLLPLLSATTLRTTSTILTSPRFIHDPPPLILRLFKAKWQHSHALQRREHHAPCIFFLSRDFLSWYFIYYCFHYSIYSLWIFLFLFDLIVWSEYQRILQIFFLHILIINMRHDFCFMFTMNYVINVLMLLC